MVAAAKLSSPQTMIGGLSTDQDLLNEKKAAHLWRTELWWAMRSFVESYIDAENGMKKYDGCAFRLNQHWEELGRPVTPGALKNALEDSNRNNFRLEWAFWFASQDQDVAKILARHIKPAKTVEQYNADLEAEVRETLSHKEAEKVIRRARAK